LGKVKEMGLRFIDLQLVDLPGRLHSATIAARELSLDSFKVGVPKLDGSSIRGFVEVHESDMVLVPDPSTFAPIPWASQEHRAARLICNVHWGFTGDRFSRDPRFVAQRAEQVLRDELGGDASSLWGPEPEFFILDRVEWDVLSPHRGQSYRIESREAA
jgi:glutamine synthetase